MLRTFSLLTLLLYAAPLGAGNQPPVLEHWDVVYLQNNRAGHVHTLTEKIDLQGQAALRSTVELRLQVKRFNETVQLGMDTGSFEDLQGRVIGVFMRQYLGKAKTLEIVGGVVGDRLKLVQVGGKPLESAPWNPEVLGVHAQQTLFQKKKLKPADRFTYPSFEPTVNLVLTTTVEAKDFEEVKLLDGKRQRLLRVESKPERLEKVQLPTQAAWVDGEGQVLKQQFEAPGLGLLVLYRTSREAALAPASNAVPEVGQVVKLKQRLLNPHKTVAAVYRIQVQGDDDPTTAFLLDERQSINKAKGDTFELAVRNGQAPAEVKAPTAEYLQSSFYINSADPKVGELARRAVGGETDPWRKALKIERWVHANMQARHHESLAPADHVARTLEGDCTEYAMLMAAMCRAVEVPSRTALGLIYAEVKGQPLFAFHMWTEVWAQGRWQPLDATLGQGGIGAAHLKIAHQSWHDTRTMTPLFPVMRVLGRVSIDILSAE